MSSWLAKQAKRSAQCMEEEEEEELDGDGGGCRGDDGGDDDDDNNTEQAAAQTPLQTAQMTTTANPSTVDSQLRL